MSLNVVFWEPISIQRTLCSEMTHETEADGFFNVLKAKSGKQDISDLISRRDMIAARL